MNTSQFLKVTPKDGGRSVVVPAQNRAFYLSQGAKVEPATEAEIRKEFPEYAARVDRANAASRKAPAQNVEPAHDAEKDAEIARLQNEIKERDAKIAELESANEQLRMVAGGDAPESEVPAKKTSSRRKK